MKLNPRLTHAALRTRTAKVRAAAHDRDDVRFRRELRRLVTTLDEHLDAESLMLEGLPETAAIEVNEGQARIRSTVTALVRTAMAGPGCDDCETLARELDELLGVQDVAERGAFRLRDRRDPAHDSSVTRTEQTKSPDRRAKNAQILSATDAHPAGPDVQRFARMVGKATPSTAH